MSNFYWTNPGELYIYNNVKVSVFSRADVHVSLGFGGIHCEYFTEATKNLPPANYLSSFFLFLFLSPLVKPNGKCVFTNRE